MKFEPDVVVNLANLKDLCFFELENAVIEEKPGVIGADSILESVIGLLIELVSFS